ncbi:hypothetical protein [Nocardioides dongkuii]|uniref:hypothetical protein n=1 Tax=Nocardioides dongkuii TaxID=2760089 RepID=UPI0015FBBF62|nr:hypothetical protein [Nocardioides dongkuii]
MDAVTHHQDIVGLADRLVLEFGDTMPPGQILGIVHRANRLVVQTTSDQHDALALCESIARRLISGRWSGTRSHVASA